MGRYSVTESQDFTEDVTPGGKKKTRQMRSMTFRPSMDLSETPLVSNGVRWFHTANIFATLFAMGLVSALTGTTFEDLHIIFGNSVESVTRILISKSVGTFIGVIMCGGLVFHYVNARIVMLWSSVFGGIGTAVAPLVSAFWMVHAGMFITGSGGGIFECGANVWLVHLWGKNIGPILQIYNLVFGIGALVAPPLTAPFIRQNATLTHLLQPEHDTETRVWIPYMLFGSLYVAIGLSMIVGFCLDRTNLCKIVNIKADSQQVTGPTKSCFEWPLVAFTCGFILFSVCIEQTLGQMSFLYAEHNPDIRLTPSQASTLVTVFWATYTAGRLIATFLSFVMRPYRIVLLSTVFLLIGCGFFVLCMIIPSSSKWAVWVGTALMGCGVSPLYGSGCAWAFQYFHLGFIQMALILTAACTGQSLPTYLVAPYVETSPNAVPYVLVGECVGLALVTAAMLYWTNGAQRITTDDDEIHIVDFVDDENVPPTEADNRRSQIYDRQL